MPDLKLLTGHVVDAVVGRGVGPPMRLHDKGMPLLPPVATKPLDEGKRERGKERRREISVNVSVCVSDKYASYFYLKNLSCKCN